MRCDRRYNAVHVFHQYWRVAGRPFVEQLHLRDHGHSNGERHIQLYVEGDRLRIAGSDGNASPEYYDQPRVDNHLNDRAEWIGWFGLLVYVDGTKWHNSLHMEYRERLTAVWVEFEFVYGSD